MMLRLKSIILYENKPKIKLVLQKNKIFRVLGAVPQTPEHSPSTHCRFLITRLILDVCFSCFHVRESYIEKLLSKPNNSRYLRQKNNCSFQI